MTVNLKGLTLAYDQQTSQLIKGSSRELTLRLPVSRIASGVNFLFGDTTRETDDTGTVKGPFKCLWYDALSARSRSPSGHETVVQRLAGQYQNATAFAELVLKDVLVKTTDIEGDTWFDRSKDILSNGQKYKYVASVRLGLSVGSPVIIMVILEGGRGYAD